MIKTKIVLPALIFAGLVAAFQACSPFSAREAADKISSAGTRLLPQSQSPQQGLPIPSTLQTGTIQGYAEPPPSDAALFSPGMRLSVYASYGTGDTWWGPSLYPGRNFFSLRVPAGRNNLGLMVPAGFSAQVSACVNCTNHPEASFHAVARGTGVDRSLPEVPANGYVDLRIRFTRNPNEPAPSDTNRTLTCNFNAYPSTTNEETFSGSGARLRIGISADFAGILTAFELTNPARPTEPANILAEGVGASMQTTLGGRLTGPGFSNRFTGVDQGVGGAYLAWGHAATFRGLQQTDWTPLWTGSFDTIPNSPCYNNAAYLFDGKQKITGTTLPTAHGNAVRLVNSYSYRPVSSWSWSGYELEQAFYLNRPVAKSRFLRVYLAGDGWLEGPIRPYDDFTLAHRQGACDNGTDPLMRFGCRTDNIRYVVFVYSVGGTDIGVAISKPDGSRFYGSLNMQKLVFCQNPNDVACGAMEWHSFHRSSTLDPSPIWNMTAGQVYADSLHYTVGTLAQLADLGFSITQSPAGTPVASTPTTTTTTRTPANTPVENPPPPTPPPTPSPALVVYENFASTSSSDSLCPASAAVDHNPGTSYCSHSQSSSLNPSANLAAWFGNGPMPVNRVFLHGRMFNGALRAFPKRYRIYLTSADNSRWVSIGEFRNQPASGEAVTGINLPATYSTHGILIAPLELGQDENGAYAFQISELTLGYQP